MFRNHRYEDHRSPKEEYQRRPREHEERYHPRDDSRGRCLIDYWKIKYHMVTKVE